MKALLFYRLHYTLMGWGKKLEFELFLPEGELMVGPRHVSNVCLKNDQNPCVGSQEL